MESKEQDIMVDYQAGLITDDEALEKLKELYPDEEEDALRGIVEDWEDEDYDLED